MKNNCREIKLLPFEGLRIAFNGTEGRLEAWLNIPYQKKWRKVRLNYIQQKWPGQPMNIIM